MEMDLAKMRVILEMEKKNYTKALENARKETEQATKKIEAEMEKAKQSSGKIGEGLSQSQIEVQRTMKNIRGALSLPLRAIQTLRERMANMNPHTMKSNAYSDIQAEIENTESKIKSLRREQVELMDSGKGMVLTNEYKEIAASVANAEKHLNSLLDKEERFRATGGKTNSQTYKRMQYDIEEAKNTLAAYKADLADIENNGIVSEHSAEWKKVESKIDEAKKKLQEFNSEKSRMESDGSAYAGRGFTATGMKNASGTGGKFSKVFSGMNKVFASVTNGIKKTSGAFGALIHRLRNGIPIFNKTRKSAAGLGNQMRGLSGLFRTIGMTAKFMFASFIIMGAVNGIKEGMQNLAQYSERTNASLSMLMSSLTQLKNALATAFAPILHTIAPLLNMLIQKVTQAVSAIGMLFASLTGQSIFTRAKEVNQDYAASLNQNAAGADKANEANKKLQRTLLGFDQINKLDDNESDSGSGGGAGGLSPSDMFEEVPISNKIKEFADKLKEAWKNADFTDIGRIVGEKLNKALEGIPWEKIKATTNKIAKSIATFLNGFLETVRWTLVGETIAQGINTAFEFVSTFVRNFHWNSLGKAIGNLINGACRRLDWNLIHGTLKETVTGIITTIKNLLSTADFRLIGNTFGNFIQSFILIGYTWVTQFPWVEFGKKIAEGLNGAIEKIDIPMLGTTIGKLITGIFSMFKNFAQNFKWKEFGNKIAEGINNMFKALDPDEVAGGINKIVNGICDMLGTVLEKVNWGEVFGKMIEVWNKLDWKIKLAVTALIIGKALFGALGLVFKNPTLFAEIAKTLTPGLTKTFGESVAKALSSIPMALAGAAGIGAIAFNVYDVFSGMRDSIKNKDIFGIVDSIKGFFSLPDIPNSMNAGVKKALAAVGFKNPIQEKFADAKEWLIEKGVSTIDGLMTGINNKYPTVREFFGNLSGNVRTATGDSRTWLPEKGRSSIEGLKSGYESAKGTFFSLIQRLRGETFTAAGDMKGNIQPKGKDIISGLISGFQANKPSFTSMVSSIPDLIKKGIGDLGTIGKNAMASFARGFSSVHIPMPHIGMDWSSVNLGKTSFSIPKFRLNWYAGGGFPGMGEMFVARENGPELVGRMGNSSAVANNGQIVEGIKKGVYDAVAPLFSQFRADGNEQTPIINVYLGTKQITDIFIEDINDRTISTGECPIKV